MDYTLYYSPGTASMAVHWMLIELGVPFGTRLIDIEQGAQNDPAYRQLNPAGRVPTLVIDGVPHGESTALLMLLAEQHPQAGMAPAPGSALRAEWLETMIFLANTLLPAMRDWFYADKDGAAESPDVIRNLARFRIEGAFDRLDAMLADGREFLLGGPISTADFLATMLMRWSRNMPRPSTNWPNIARYAAAMKRRASYETLRDREGLSAW